MKPVFVVEELTSLFWEVEVKKSHALNGFSVFTFAIIRIRYEVQERRFICMVIRRYSPVSKWTNPRVAKPKEIDWAMEAIGPEAIARCVAASITANMHKGK